MARLPPTLLERVARPTRKAPQGESVMAEDVTLFMTRTIAASPERVFDAWTKSDQWAKWMGPEGVKGVLVLQEPHVGGRYKLAMNLADGKKCMITGTYKIIERPSRV